MTLFEAIRELKEGQIIEGISPIRTSYASSDGRSGSSSYNPCYVEWKHGKDKPIFIDNTIDLNTIVSIVDLPKPKMSLEEGLEKAAFECLIGKRFDISEPTGYCWTANGIGYPTWAQAVAAAFASALRSLPIDWLAEADRKEGK